MGNPRAKKRPPARTSRPFQDVVRGANELDRRRRRQVANQVDSINRLLASTDAGWQYDQEMGVLHEALASAQAELAEMKEHHMGRKKDAFMAGFEAGETVEDKDAAWKEYKEGLEEDEDTATDEG